MGRGKWEWGRIVTAQPSPHSKGDLYDVDLEIVLTGQDAEGPPAPPYTGDAFAGIQRSGSDGSAGAGHGYLIFTDPYDPSAGGWDGQADDGPISTNPPDVNGYYHGVTVSASMYARIYLRATYTANIGHVPITIFVMVNGVAVGSSTRSTYGNTMTVDLRNYPLNAGDVVECFGSPQSTFFTNSGTNGTQLIVGRGSYPLVHLGGTGTTFVGP